MPEGTIKWVNHRDGYGFINQDDDEEDVYFKTQWVKGVSINEIREGMRVEYDTRRVPQGLQTKWVRAVAAQERAPNTFKREGYRFLNPYNFVRYLDKPAQEPTVESPAELLMWRCPPPPHDRYVGLTGSITCTVEAKTPLFISDSHAVDEDGNGHKSYRFFQYEDRPALPASSLRGMVRSVFEAVTNSCFAVFDGSRLDIRKAQLPRGLVPARMVEMDENGAKLELLDCSEGYPDEVKRHWRKGELVDLMKAASVSAYEERVLDTREDPPIPLDPTQSKVPDDIKDGDRVAALISLQLVDNKLYEYFPVVKVVPVAHHNELHEYKGVKKVFGYAHITGPNIERKHLERIFFRWDDATPETTEWQDLPEQVREEVDARTVQEYNQHLAEYWERNRNQIQKLDAKGHPWPIDADSLPHPSTFVKKGRKLRKGDLVYYIPCSKAGFALLRPVLISRLPYRFSRADLLSERKHLKKCNLYKELCPACRVFGWVHENASHLDRDKRVAYAGRVRLSHGKPMEGTLDYEDPMPLAILSTPKPTTTPFYLLDPDGSPDAQVDYDTPNVRLRGRKFYRHQGKANPDEYKGSDKSDQNRTVRDVLKPGAQFTFTLEFENLAKVELGALLYALELEDDLVHRLGYAKPLGFGSVKVKISKMQVVDSVSRYTTLRPTNGGWTSIDLQKREEWIAAFKQAMTQVYGENFDDLDNIQDLRALLGEPPYDLPVHYPRSKQEPDPDGKNYEWFEGNEKRKQALLLAPDDTRGFPVWDSKGNEVRE